MQKKPNLTQDEASQAAKALELLFASEYISKKKLYKENFIRGIFFSVGSIIGATIIIVVGVWILSFFETVPLVGPVFNNFKTTIENTQK